MTALTKNKQDSKLNFSNCITNICISNELLYMCIICCFKYYKPVVSYTIDDELTTTNSP